MTWPPDQGEWEPIEQDWGHKAEDPDGSTVRVIPATSVEAAVTAPLREDLDLPPVDELVRKMPEADLARLGILEAANDHIVRALDEMRDAVSWFGVVDRTDQSEIIRQVESLAETIAYRLRNARG